MPEFTRRRLLTLGAATAGLAVLPAAPALADTGTSASAPARRLPSDLFRLGVASGDPLPDSVVLWTRLAPRPTDGGGMPDRHVPVRWEIAEDESFRRPLRRGEELARPELGHSVHVDLRGLRPGADYFYRFRAGDEISPVGRTRTAPARGAHPQRLRFAFASCQNYQDGYYVAHRDLAEQDVDFVAFLGDYIYESKPDAKKVRVHEGTDEPYSLTDYRNRYAQYRTDSDLQAAHQAFPWIITIDDHEIDNDWAGLVPQDPDKQTPEAFLARRVAAFQAWYEHMPVRRTQFPHGPDMRIFRRFEFGDLARVHVLDSRQYRSDQPATPADADDPSRTMLGAEQEKWLVNGMTTGSQQWNLLANNVPMAQTDQQAGPGQTLWTDPWDGYRVQRRRLFDVMGSDRVRNPVVCTGDRHFTMACDLRTDFDDPDSTTVAAEITGTSVTSGGDGDQNAWHQQWDQIIAESPHWKYGDGRRGYVLCDVDRERLLARLRVAPVVTDRDGAVTEAARFVVEAGRRGVQVD
ncbi:alkaline phosphatase D family protein [Goodfellowiella coeruleoviolacea]|uniref:Alkaline phosphatase D n=1 Tax=Goodfellowiella coeruleoviolacea TaxID=334858 RepID=A0AAE3KKQ9_9PSEU|nr:alkaline phosphatase D family protein [Goodfellowiella coeruleoviolacea]MCP2169624.1 alkaline phosphatase D [Goodfellowiella coeruleoviolacea]